MKRIFTSTSVANLFGVGLRGFTDGNAIIALAPTRLNANWFNNVQESIARTIESNGAELPAQADPENYWMLDDAVARQFYMSTVDTGGVIHGLRFQDLGGLIGQVTPGVLHQAGRRYVITEAKIAARYPDGFPLTPSADNWIFLAADLGEPGVPDRGVVYIDILTSDVGDPMPGGGQGFLVMRVRTDAGSVVGVTYFGHGPKVLTDVNSGVWFRRPDRATQRTDVMPIGDVAIGVRQHPEYESEALRELGAPIESIATEWRYLRSAFSSLSPYAWLIEGTTHGFTSGGGSANVSVEPSSADYVNGTTCDVVVRGAATFPSNTALSYSFQKEFHLHKTGGAWSLEGTGTGGPSREFGTTGDVIDVSGNISGNSFRLAFTGHSTEAMRWFCYVSTVVNGLPA